MDDILDTKFHARQTAIKEAIKAGIFPGVSSEDLDTPEALEGFYTRMENEPPTILIYQVSEEQLLQGLDGGVFAANVIRNLPKNCLGYVLLTFEPSPTPLPLWAQPVVQLFCHGMLLGNDLANPDPSIGASVIPFLLDENEWSRDHGASAYDLPGRVWVAGLAQAEHVYRRSRTSPVGWARDIGMATHFLDIIMSSTMDEA